MGMRNIVGQMTEINDMSFAEQAKEFRPEGALASFHVPNKPGEVILDFAAAKLFKKEYNNYEGIYIVFEGCSRLIEWTDADGLVRSNVPERVIFSLSKVYGKFITAGFDPDKYNGVVRLRFAHNKKQGVRNYTMQFLTMEEVPREDYGIKL